MDYRGNICWGGDVELNRQLLQVGDAKIRRLEVSFDLSHIVSVASVAACIGVLHRWISQFPPIVSCVSDIVFSSIIFDCIPTCTIQFCAN